MRVGSLFSGIGGIDLGLERAGMRVVWQVECDPFCVNVLERHWPAVHRRRDVRLANAGNLEPVDLIAGGFPCQDVSTAGKGAGLERGHRSGLWRDFARIVRELRPRWVLVENVPALRGRGADIVLGDLEAEGYACWPLVVGARHVGAPHRRDRVWIVGHRAGDGGKAAILAGGEEAERGPQPHGTVGRLADGDGAGCAGERRTGLLDGERAALGDDADRCDGLGNGHHAGLEGWRVLGGERPHQWPARPASRQNDWEPPRTFESRLGRGAHGISGRLGSARWRNALKALGNAVVPQVVELIGRAILAVDAP